jgi:limonene-1,2-epoxide hydrolase
VSATPPGSEVVLAFLHALADGDVDAALALTADDIVYTNVSLPTIRGKRAFARSGRAFYRYRLGFDVRVHRIAQDGASVLTERTDAILFGPFRAQFWVCGVFEVHDGKITLWRDYFDWFNVKAAILRGLVGTVVPPARARLPQSR